MAIVSITEEAQEQFETLPKLIQVRMEKIFVRLQNWPDISGAKPLRGELAGRYRIRTGDYRIQFQVRASDSKNEPIADHVVVIEEVGH
jgi:mRNA-degrading endonuclease RelE of RelBE toxin-antitoxin system